MPLYKEEQPPNPSAVELLASMTDTYFWLRWTTGIIAAAFPLLLLLGGMLVYHLELQGSMSAYYHTPMRDWFVGVLFAVGAALYFYEGITDLENHFMTAAAYCAILTAINPSKWTPTWWPSTLQSISPHGIFAVSFFVAIILSAWFCKHDILKLRLVTEGAEELKKKYGLISIALLAAPAAAVVLTLKDGKLGDTTIFFVEWAALGSFTWYWFTKTGELTRALDAAKKKAGEEPQKAMGQGA